jgi:4-amino-4-deoxy-L-arabinose transferase-like glycosyltransferase
MNLATRPGLAWREVGLVVLALAALLLAVASEYGPHRDELYFASAADRLAWGYPDQPSMVAVSAWLSDAVAPGSLVALRVPSALAVCVVVACTAATARLLGGGRAAQVLTAVLVATGAVTVAFGHMLSTVAFEYAAWSGVLLLAASALVEDNPRRWLWAGVVAGVGLHAKHSLVVCLAGLFVGLVLTRAARHHLRSPWLWLGGSAALMIWLPNLWWQADHGWPVFELGADIREEYGGLGARLEFVLVPLVMFSPLMTVLWVIGLWQLLRSPGWAVVRPLGWVFVVSVVAFGLSGGKPYYLAPAIPVLLAAGCVWLARRWSTRGLVWGGVVLVASAAVAWPGFIPLLPASQYAQSPYPDIDENQLETIGWPEYVDTVRDVVAGLSAEERESVVVFTRNYGEAGAVEWYDVGVPVYSGHNAFGEWGPPPDSAAPVVVVGLEPSESFVGCEERARIDNEADADNEERGMAVWVCAGPRAPWSEIWPELEHLSA